MFKSSYAELKPGIWGRGFSEKGKQPAGELAATVMVNLPVTILVESLCGCHCLVPNPHCLKGVTALALANKLLVFSASHKLDGIPSRLKWQELKNVTDITLGSGALPADLSRPRGLDFTLGLLPPPSDELTGKQNSGRSAPGIFTAPRENN